MVMKSDGILNPRRVMKIYYMSQKYEFVQICSRFVAVYLRLHLKVCTLQTRLRTNLFAILRFHPLYRTKYHVILQQLSGKTRMNLWFFGKIRNR